MLFRGLVAPGLAALVIAFVGLSVPFLRGDLGSSEPAATTAPAGATAFPDRPVFATYRPGESTGWHRHPGAIHSVFVLSGTLTVYGEDCSVRRFGVGEGYVGGEDLHLARNDDGVRLELMVEYRPAAATTPGSLTVPMGPPAGCPPPG
ncbi:MAG: cupin domain-containing protein [Acidimicrobiales bacterium]